MSTKNIEPKLRLISDYTHLQGKDKFCVPEYQRSYAWTHDHCDKLWQDITSYMDSGAEDPYFFGTVILDCSESNKLNLIDGQQRTTTFLLLLKALHLVIGDTIKKMNKSDDTIPLMKGLERSYAQIFEILYKADEDLQYEISKDWSKAKSIQVLVNDSINEIFKTDFQNIVEAESFYAAERAVHHIPRKQKDNKYTNFFRNFKFFYNKLKEFSESSLNLFAKTFLRQCQIIEIKSWDIEQAITMFNSLNSTGMPLSDADIISAKLYSKADSDRKEYMDNWKDLMEKCDVLKQRKILDIDGVLQQFMYINRAKNKEYTKNQVATPGIRKYYTIENERLLDNPLELSEAFTKIMRIWDKIQDYPMIKLLLKFNENFKLWLISYLYRFEVENIDEETVKPVTELLIRLFAILEISDVGFSSSRFKTFLFNENLKIVDPSISLEEIIEDFNNHISSTWKREDLKEELMNYDKNILVFLNDFLYAKDKGQSFDFQENVNVEHIMPSSGHNLASIRKDAGIESLDEFKRIVNLLGNKILLEEDINKSISNDWFKTKKGNYVKDKMGYLGSKYSLAQNLANFNSDRWTKDDIEHYTIKAAERILDYIFGETNNNPLIKVEGENGNSEPINPIDQPNPEINDSNNLVGKLFYINSVGCDAVGEFVSNNAIRIKRGSILRESITKSFRENDKIKRLELLDKHCQLTEKGYIAVEDFPLLSPSAASGIVQGRSSNGLEDWLDASGQPLSTYLV